MLGLINIAIILITLGFFSVFFNYSYAKNGDIGFPVLQNTKFDLWHWIEDHATTVTLIGIITAFLSVEIQRYRQKRDEALKQLFYNIAYFEAVGGEVKTIKTLMDEVDKADEGGYEVFDIVFPTEAYDRMSIIEIETVDTRTRQWILDFYNTVKRRNRTYLHRNEVKHRFIRTKDDRWNEFIEYIDFKISKDDAYLSSAENIDQLIILLDGELMSKKKDKEFEYQSFFKRLFNSRNNPENTKTSH